MRNHRAAAPLLSISRPGVEPVTSVASWLRYDRQEQCRWMRLIVINHIRRFDHPPRARLRFAGVQVAVEPRTIAAGNFQPELVPGEKHIARRPQIHPKGIPLSPIPPIPFLLGTPV